MQASLPEANSLSDRVDTIHLLSVINFDVRARPKYPPYGVNSSTHVPMFPMQHGGNLMSWPLACMRSDDAGKACRLDKRT